MQILPFFGRFQKILGRFINTFGIGVTNLLTLAGLWTLFGVVRPSVTDLLDKTVRFSRFMDSLHPCFVSG